MSNKSPEIISPDLSDVYFIGEGMDNIVIAISSQNKVLRIRKTEIGNLLNYDKFINKIRIDLDFQHNILTPLLGTLFVDNDFRIVIIEKEKMSMIIDKIDSQRQSNRKNKQMNPFGLAVLCRNACDTFVERKGARQTVCGDSKGESEKEKHLTSGSANKTNNVKVIGSRRNQKFSDDENILIDSCMSKNMNPPNVTQISSFKIKPKKICVELKLKQSFPEILPNGDVLCKFCLKQHLKVKIGKEASRSCFCPLDLFSGNVTKMRTAIDNLFNTPKTNLKIFEEGKLIEEGLKENYYLKEIILNVLLCDLYSSHSENKELNFEATENNHKDLRKNLMSSMIGHLMCLQSLDYLGTFKASELYLELLERLGSKDNVNDKLQDSERLHKNYGSTEDFVKKLSENYKKFNGFHQNSSNDENLLQSDKKFHDKNYLNFKISNSDHISSFSEMSTEEILKMLQHYLIAMTLKDVSIMIILDGPYEKAMTHVKPHISPFCIFVEKLGWFKCQITFVDLILKPPQKILEHKGIINKLISLAEELSKNEKIPSCCTLSKR